MDRKLLGNLGLFCGIVALMSSTMSAGAEKTAPTYYKDVARILQKNCQDCHRPNQVAPFALLTYEQARKRSADLAHVTTERIMPPWPASTSYGGPFRDARVLTGAEIATLRAWAEAKCPEGDPMDAPEPRKFSSAWPLGEPDLTLTMPEPYKVAATGDDDFRVFVLKTNLPEDRWIRAVDFRPGNRSVVHHVIAGVDPSGRGRELDAADPGPGYYALGGFGDGVPITAFLPIWTPGALPRFCPEGTGFLVSALNCILAQRLVRVVCVHCKKVVRYSPEALAASGLDPAEWSSVQFVEGAGCLECSGTGFRGRSAISELLDLSDHIREMIIDRRPTSEIKRAAGEEGMMFLRDSALGKVREGLTTLKEINKVTFIE